MMNRAAHHLENILTAVVFDLGHNETTYSITYSVAPTVHVRTIHSSKRGIEMASLNIAGETVTVGYELPPEKQSMGRLN